MTVLTAGVIVAVLATGPARLPEVVVRLSAADFRTREAATRTLLAGGPTTLPALTVARRSASDPETIRRLDAVIRRLSDDHLSTPTLVTLTPTDLPAHRVVAALAERSGYPLATADPSAKTKVTLDLHRVPFWQAVDAVCDAAGLAVSADPNSGLSFHPADAHNPHVCYPGPFRVVAANASSGRTVQLAGLPRRTPGRSPPEYLSLSFAIYAEPKAPILGVGQATLTDATDDRGGSLLPPRLRGTTADGLRTSFSPPTAGYRSLTNSFGVGLYRHDRTATTLQRIAGTVPVVVLAETRPDVTFPDPLTSKGAKATGRTATVELVAAGDRNGVVTVEVIVARKGGRPDDYSWLAGLGQRFELTDAAGGPFRFAGVGSQNTTPSFTRLELRFERPAGGRLGPPARLRLVEWVTATREVRFAFTGIPLP
jgi:hypothetical protein